MRLMLTGDSLRATGVPIEPICLTMAASHDLNRAFPPGGGGRGVGAGLMNDAAPLLE